MRGATAFERRLESAARVLLWLTRCFTPLSAGRFVVANVLAVITALATVSAVFAVAARLSGIPHALVTILGFLAGGWVLAALAGTFHVVERYRAAFDMRDFAEAIRLREIIEGRREPRSRGVLAMRRLGDGELMSAFGHYEAAADAFAQIDLSLLPRVTRPGVLSQHGYALAQTGRIEEAVALTERALSEAAQQRFYPKEKRWYLRFRRAVVLSIAGDGDGALQVFDGLLAEDFGTTEERTELIYAAAHAFESAGSTDLARRFYERAATHGAGAYAAWARADLERLLADDPTTR